MVFYSVLSILLISVLSFCDAELIVQRNEEVLRVNSGEVELNEFHDIGTFASIEEASFFSAEDSSTRRKRQVQNTNQIELLLSQECNSIVLRWVPPNIPYSSSFHTSNSEFKYYNIYRELNYFMNVAGLTPIASGKTLPELQNVQLQKWFDKIPPSGMTLYYAITIVNENGNETQFGTPKQITFIGMFQSLRPSPARIIPNMIKGNVIYHSVAYNSFRNEYFVVFDVDQDNDEVADRVYGIRININGQILGQRIIDFTLRRASTEQGHPSVAFNPLVNEYLVVWHLSSRNLQGGAHVLIAQRVFGDRSFTKDNPFLLLNAKLTGRFRPVVEPKLVYNSGSAGYVMTVMLDAPPKTSFVVFLMSNGKIFRQSRLFKGEVLDSNIFVDTKFSQIYIVYQVRQHAITLVDSSSPLQHYPFVFLVTKANSTGNLLFMGSQNTIRYVVGYTREQVANMDGYFDHNNGWLTLFWNDRENGSRVIISTSIVGFPGKFAREANVHKCLQYKNNINPAVCYMPKNNGPLMLWERANKLSGYLLKDGAFSVESSLRPGAQRSAIALYNSRQKQALVLYQQFVLGTRVLFMTHVAPASQSTCKGGCKSSDRCAMKDVCVSRTPYYAVNHQQSCLKDNGGCSHTCTTLSNRRLCTCPQSFTLASNGMKCIATAAKPDVSLLYSFSKGIRSINVYYKERRVSISRIPIAGNEIIAFFYNEKDRFIYWGDARDRKIYKAHLDGTNKQAIVNNRVVLPDGMVVDPVTNKLYWADGTLNKIFRSFLDGSNVESFIVGVDKPRALLIHQEYKWLFWTNWGMVAKIERINIDGTGRKILVQYGLKWPNGLTHDGNNLYWADAHFDKIEMSDFYGNNRMTLTTKGTNHPYGLGMAKNRLFWTDWSGHIRSYNKLNSKTEDVISGLKKPFVLQVYDILKATFCRDPGVPLSGSRNPPPPISGNEYNIGDQINLTCNPGFVHLGSKSRFCLPTGKWSGKTTQCKALPVFTRLPRNKTTDVSYHLSIECSAESSSGEKTTITWYKDDKTLSVSQRYYTDQVTNYLQILNVLLDDAGKYTCEAKNSGGTVRASMYLTVRQRQIPCGKARLSARAKIIGGKRAEHGTIPWQILLFNNATKKPFCGAVLLNERWGVTAAHCLQPMASNLDRVAVIFGEYRWHKNDGTEQYRSIDKVHLNVHYNPLTYDSDIALFKFSKQVILNNYVIPVCLPTSAADLALIQANNTAKVSGWGARKTNKTRSVKTLHAVTIKTVDDKTCKANHAPKYVVTSNMLCAGLLNGKGDACHGDSGGPLTVINKGTKKTY